MRGHIKLIMSELPFIKMHGLGNDFVIVDAREGEILLDADRIRTISNRRLGVGCDQVLELRKPLKSSAEVFMRIWNADGGQAEACGNGARCVAAMVMSESGDSETIIETVAGLLKAEAAGTGKVKVYMGKARTNWNEIPLSREMDTLSLDLAAGVLKNPVAVNVGNPHAVFFVNNIETVDIEELGPGLEADPLFPNRANIGIAEIQGQNSIRLRVWERGVGLTNACGSGACASVVAAVRRTLITGRSATVVLDGGALEVDWLDDGQVCMTGPVSTSFMGLLA